MNCPACAAEMRLADYERVRINLCDACGGVWLDHKELQEIAERRLEKIDHAILDSFEHATGVTAAGSERDRQRGLKCPVCRATLSVVNYGYSSGILVDHCPADCGVFLDKGELEAAQAWTELGDEKKATMDKYYGALAGREKNWAAVRAEGRAGTVGALILGLPSRLARMIEWLIRERREKG
jgi:Zn-finger nucleic acid-binding protein